ncbi:hypothetical protein [Thiolapillus sp.]|uniref:hypothetical protein n=2 Tax=Thiolapillus sp. TaxID=2017437 RepID=UPI003AF76DB8
MMIIAQYTRARLVQYGFYARIEGIEFDPRNGVRFCFRMRQEQIRDWGRENLSGRQYGDLKAALRVADVAIQACVANGKVDVSKSVFPARGCVDIKANDAVAKVATQVREQLGLLLPLLEADCHRLYEAGQNVHGTREIALGDVRVTFTEEPCGDFDFGWSPQPGDTLDDLLGGGRYLNLRIRVFRAGRLIAEKVRKGVVDTGNSPHYGGIGRALLREAITINAA